MYFISYICSYLSTYIHIFTRFKRGNVMGSIRLRSETNNLFIDFRYQGVRYRKQTSLSNSEKNRKIVEKRLKRIEAEALLSTLDIGNHFPGSNMHKNSFTCETEKFDHFAKQWLQEKRVEWRKSYYSDLKSIIENHLNDKFGDSLIKNISKTDILVFRNSLASKASGRGENTYISTSRINHILSTLRMILKDAADRFGYKSEFRNIKALKLPKTNIKPFSVNEINKILDNVDNLYKSYFVVRFFTGLRTSEINGLKWKYIDFESRQILIREAWINGKSTPVKNDGSSREVSMTKFVYETFKAQQKISGEKRYVFTNKNNNPIDSCNFCKRIWYPVLDRIDLERRRPYETRHTTASLWLASGESPEWIAKQLGHSTTSMLFKVYSAYVPNLARRDGLLAEKVINEQLNKHTRR